MHLIRINRTDDLSYLETPQGEKNPTTGVIGEELVPTEVSLIDPGTLQMLLEEAREDDERRSIMYEFESGDAPHRDEALALAIIEDKTQNKFLREAEELMEEVNNMSEKYSTDLEVRG